MDKVQKIREEVERLKEWQPIATPSLNKLLSLLDTMQEEPVSIWHDAKEAPEMYRKYFARYSDGRIDGYWARHDDGFIPWKDVVKEHHITHWCYVSDVINLIKI